MIDKLRALREKREKGHSELLQATDETEQGETDGTVGSINLMHGDCLEEMKGIPDGSVDMVLCDPPYGVTACKWDSVIPLKPMWEQLNRIVKKDKPIALTASQPFTTTLIQSNLKGFKYCWVWNKSKAGNFAVAKHVPLRVTEDIVIFNSKVYFPQMVPAKEKNKRPRSKAYDYKEGLSQHIGSKHKEDHDEDLRYPTNVIDIKSTEKECNNAKRVHPSQKPISLMEYLIKTYTNEGDVVLDFTMGSGSTGVACKNLNRKFIGIELDKDYFDIAKERIENI